MHENNKPYLPFPRKYFIIFVYLFVSALILLAFITYPGFNWYSRVMFADMVYGDAYKPFVYRTLVPSTIRLVTAITPQFIIDKIESIAKRKSIMLELIYISDMEDEYIYEFIVSLIIMLLCFAGFALAIRRLIMIQYDFPDYVADLAPVGALLVIPAFFRYYNELYDPATLCLFALGILSVSIRKRFWFYIVFILAAVNKETALLLSILFFIKERREVSKRALIGHLAIQFIIWLSVKVAVTVIYQNNPGSFLPFNFFGHTLTMIFRPFPLAYMLFVLLLFFLLIKYQWREKPVFLRHSFLAGFVVLAIAGMCFGVIDELRIFYEIYPMAFLLSLPTIVSVFGAVPSVDQQTGGNI